MSGFDVLNENNFIIYAMKAYQNTTCMDINEFHDDLKRLKYVKRLLNRYVATGMLRERLILNHIIIIYNIFGVEAATRILYYKLPEKFWPALTTFLVYLNYCPEMIKGVRKEPIIVSNIILDTRIIQKLRKI